MLSPCKTVVIDYSKEVNNRGMRTTECCCH